MLNKLPTSEEYRKFISIPTYEIQQFSEPKYQCHKCGGGMCKNLMIVLASNPVQYEYQCNNCGHIEYQYR